MLKSITPLQKTLLLVFVASTFSVSVAYFIQNQANGIVNSCSYLDPISIDLIALIVGLFLVIEGLVDIFGHSESLPRSQWTRVTRICFGASILTIHIMQFIHK
jgi:predicted tellurium resistance membrane protein TerC